jgi:hypothetical protein
MKPDAPDEFRGEFKPIRTNVPGFDVCELMPLQAKIADKLAVIRNLQFQQQGHTPPELFTGFLRGNRPAIGSVVSKLRSDAGVHGPLPPNVYLGDANYVGQPGFLGKAHEAYIPGQKAANLGPPRDLSLDRLADRRHLLRCFDTLRRDLDDARGSLAGMDAFNAQALEMITSTRARDAFDVGREPDRIQARYGKGTEFLQARRLVEAGVPVVTLTPRNRNPGPMCNGEWDHPCRLSHFVVESTTGAQSAQQIGFTRKEGTAWRSAWFSRTWLSPPRSRRKGGPATASIPTRRTGLTTTVSGWRRVVSIATKESVGSTGKQG